MSNQKLRNKQLLTVANVVEDSWKEFTMFANVSYAFFQKFTKYGLEIVSWKAIVSHTYILKENKTFVKVIDNMPRYIRKFNSAGVKSAAQGKNKDLLLSWWQFNPFHAASLFLYPQKTSKKLVKCWLDVFS